MIRRVTKADEAEWLKLMEEFYASSAVLHPIDPGYYKITLDEITSDSPYADGYLLVAEGKTAGYALLSKTFTSEAGGKVLWIEELYVREAFRAHGMGKEFLAFIEQEYADFCRFRLEVEPSNTRAIQLYQTIGYEFLPYLQLVKNRKG